jgi:hypothetical protein
MSDFGTFLLLLAMAGFLAGVCIGSLVDQRAEAKALREVAEADEWVADLRAAFTDEPPVVAA